MVENPIRVQLGRPVNLPDWSQPERSPAGRLCRACSLQLLYLFNISPNNQYPSSTATRLPTHMSGTWDKGKSLITGANPKLDIHLPRVYDGLLNKIWMYRWLDLKVAFNSLWPGLCLTWEVIITTWFRFTPHVPYLLKHAAIYISGICPRSLACYKSYFHLVWLHWYLNRGMICEIIVQHPSIRGSDLVCSC